jgi:peroxiredoxin Q/BCP
MLSAVFTAALILTNAEPPAATPKAPAPSVAPAAGSVVEGAPAPAFDVKSSDGTALALPALKGKPVVLFFYPKDETPGCTKEACSFRDAWASLQKQGVVLIGVSTDDDASHQAFISHHKLPFKLVSDPQMTLAKRYGVGSMGPYLNRQTIVIGSDGKVKKVFRDVDVTKHAAEVVSALSS